MNASDQPRKIVTPWASMAGGAYVHTIPTAGTTSDTNASFQQGFPPRTFQPLGSGGVPVDGGDMNGILAMATAVARWVQDSGAFAFDADHANAIGGYRKGAIVQSATTAGLLWQSTADANTTNPDAGGVGWIAVGISQSSFGTPGYRVAADGFIEQWGDISLPAGGSGNVTFPIAFPNACLNIQMTNDSGAPPSAWPGNGNRSRTGFTAYSATSSGVGSAAAGVTHSWRAIGY